MKEDSWYAIKLNDKYWLGHHATDISGSFGAIGPSLSGAILISTNSSKKLISSFRNMAKEHGGQIVKLNLDMTTAIDEMLKSKFEKMEDISTQPDNDQYDCGRGFNGRILSDEIEQGIDEPEQGIDEDE